jgi:hypothetical protein
VKELKQARAALVAAIAAVDAALAAPEPLRRPRAAARPLAELPRRILAELDLANGWRTAEAIAASADLDSREVSKHCRNMAGRSQIAQRPLPASQQRAGAIYEYAHPRVLSGRAAAALSPKEAPF